MRVGFQHPRVTDLLCPFVDLFPANVNVSYGFAGLGNVSEAIELRNLFVIATALAAQWCMPPVAIRGLSRNKNMGIADSASQAVPNLV